MSTPLLSKSVLDYYSKYEKPISSMKSQNMIGTIFEIDERYEIIDSGLLKKILAIKKKLNSWSRGIWNCS